MKQLTLEKLTAVALVGMAVAHVVSTLVVEGEISPLVLVIDLPLLALAYLVTTGRSWATTVAAALSGLLLIATAAGSSSRLTQPGEPEFLGVLLFLILALVAVIAGIGASVQRHRYSEKPELAEDIRP